MVAGELFSVIEIFLLFFIAIFVQMVIDSRFAVDNRFVFIPQPVPSNIVFM